MFCALGSVVLVALFLPWAPPLMVALANLCWLLLLLALLVPWHELGHVVALLALGGRLFTVRWGVGRIVWQGRWRSVSVILGQNLFSGITLGGFASSRLSRLRLAGFVAAGPAANLLLAGVLLWWQGGWRLPLLGNHIAWWELLTVATLLQAIMALAPVSASVGAQRLPTDGAWLLNLLLGRVSRATIQQSYFANGLQQAVQSGDLTMATAMAAEAIARHPDETWAQELNVLNQLVQGEGEGALRFYRQLLGDEAVAQYSDLQCAILLNNAAWAAVLVGGQENLAAGLTQAEQAFAMLPWVDSVCITYGAILVENGDAKTALRPLTSAYYAYREPHGKAIAAGYLALVRAMQGDGARSEMLLAEARSLAPGHIVITRLASRIAAILSTLEAG